MSAAVKHSVVQDPQLQLSRTERKRRSTRAKIIAEAESLMRGRPVDEVSVQDITAAADIGHGTFYLHFKSKYEVLIPIIQNKAASWDLIFQNNLVGIDDPAEVVAFSTRHMARIIVADPLWCWLLQHSGLPVEDMRDAVGRFSARDFGRGLLSGRFNVPDLVTVNSFLLGGFVSTILASIHSTEPENMIDCMVEGMLRVIGIDQVEASTIAHQPLKALTVD